MSDEKRTTVIVKPIVVNADRIKALARHNIEMQKELAASRRRQARLARMIRDLIAVIAPMLIRSEPTTYQAAVVVLGVQRDFEEMSRGF